MFLKVNIPKNLYYSEEFDQDLKKFLSEVELNGHIAKEPVGDAKTTVGVIDKLNEIRNFNEIFRPLIVPYVMEYAKLIGKKISGVNVSRAWVNEIFKGTSAKAHTHIDPRVDAVVIFYYKAPYNSSHLVLIHKEKIDPSKIDINDFSLSDKSYIRVETGDLIIHLPEVIHGVSEHLSDESRICFVFDLKFIE